ncbi:MAG: PhzF family phenazine biosynthesis protein [Ornithinimicrobium sp.]
MPKHLFSQVDVFCGSPFRGNPVAVVHDAVDDQGEDLDPGLMRAFSRWTNLSETTFLLPPTDPRADYRLRILTPHGELPFAGHPTLGSCRAWLAVGGKPASEGRVVQQCEAGVVTVRHRGEELAFAAPPLSRSGPPEAPLREAVLSALGLSEDHVLDMEWVVNGPQWLGVLLPDAEAVLAARPDAMALQALGGAKIGLIGRHRAGAEADFEVRAFSPGSSLPEDPATGSLQAGLAQWLIGAGIAPPSYRAAQGTVIDRTGRVWIEQERTGDDNVVWVGGQTALRVAGAVDLT